MTVTEIRDEQMEVKKIKLAPGWVNRADLKGTDWDEFAASIKAKGVMQSLWVRPAEKAGEFYLIAGERRLTAAKQAGLKSVPVRVFPVDEKAAVEMQAIENIQRKNLGPIDEADALQRLLDLHGDMKVVAGAVNRSAIYVGRALALRGLPQAVKDLIQSGVLTPGHGHQIARLPEGKQLDHVVEFATTLNWAGKYPSLQDLEQEIRNTAENDLSNAPFPQQVEYAGKEPCTECAYNSGNQNTLFDGAEGGRCSNGECFAAKVSQWQDEFVRSEGEKRPGMKSFGIKAVKTYMGEHAGNPILEGPALKDKAVKDAMKKNPEKFGFVIEKGAMRTHILCLDRDVLPKGAVRDREVERKESAEDQRKRGFIETRVRAGLLKAYASGLKTKVDREILLGIALAERTGDLGAVHLYALGVDCGEDDVRNAARKLKDADLVRLSILRTIDIWNVEGELKERKFDVKKHLKTLTAEAEKEWEKQKEAL